MPWKPFGCSPFGNKVSRQRRHEGRGIVCFDNFRFGYGLTYGDVTVSDASATRERASVTVENRGSRVTEDVVQLYLRDNESADAPANPILCGFCRVALAPGERKTVEIAIDPAALTVVNAEGRRIPGSGSWTLYAGLGQPDARTAELTGKTAVAISLK